jgi:hypothetical protein
MTDYFGERSRQVEPGTLVAFGIEVKSRYGQAQELIELLDFAESAARKNVAHHVKQAYYDSKMCLCSFTLDPSVREGDPIAALILEAATEGVGQFEWFGVVRHGGPLVSPARSETSGS